MSGIKEITTIVDACREYAERKQGEEEQKRWIVLPLHSTLSLQVRNKQLHIHNILVGFFPIKLRLFKPI